MRIKLACKKTIKRQHHTLTVKGMPNLDSFPKVSSGKDTPISEIAIFSEETPSDQSRQ